jgi:hypothetical protein
MVLGGWSLSRTGQAGGAGERPVSGPPANA